MTTLSSTRRSMLLIGIPVLAVLGGAIWLITHHKTDAAPPPAQTTSVVATTTRVQQHDVPIYLTGIGTVTARESVTVRARVDGQLEAIGFKEGQDVTQGQLIAQIDPRTLQAQLDQALAQKAKDAAQLANARLDLRRYTDLAKQNASPRQLLDTQRAQVAQLEAALQADEAQVNYAKTQFSFTRITAPISGRVGARLVDPGNIVHATDPNGLVVINQIDPISVVFTLPEESFQDINQALHNSKTPLAVTAYARNNPEALGQGHLILLNNQIDTSTGTVQLKADFPNSDHKLWPGQYVNARLYLGVRKSALTIPSQAVLRGPEGNFTFVVDANDTARVQAIHVLGIQDGLAIVDKGLQAGQRIVTDGQYKLKTGVKVTESSPQKAASTTQDDTN
ncbi:efflux RND transporter periplasmic adaptor subunit [Paralcaligenes ureilyticus]|uniref:Multidrug efflux system membrane fusion protein n=1 Tax=Paralcaligenes ureilyticus TaxID=627131 RepID=A0A4R3M8I5_9BURK|nr:efflux RND transporter periplasmic adaptor subunit [Paralcaligenes ureilyticus]TCT08599.1 multidrug efflux system membrane fusion protein [Paralcaligenes ureilyticus]